MRVLLVILSALLLVACQQEQAGTTEEPVSEAAPEFGGEVIAQVAGKPVYEDVLAALIRARHPQGATEAQREQARKQLLDLYVLEMAARDNGMLDRRGVKAEMEIQRLSQVANLVLSEYAREHPVTEEDVRQEYEDTVSRSGGSQYLLHHILVSERERAEQLIDELQAGRGFSELETELAPELGASNAGELGWVELNQVPESFAVAVEALDNGQYTPEPVQSDYGWHVILKQDERALDAPTLESVESNIRSMLGRQKLEDYVGGLREQAGVTVTE